MAKRPTPKPASINFVGAPDAGTIYQVVYCGNYDVVEHRNGKKTRVFHHFNPEKTAGKCGCPKGSQKLAVHNIARELANLGGRGGMKTDAGLVIAMRAGDEPWNPQWVPYIQYDNYRCLILRKNTKDLEDWFARAKRFYGRMGAELTSTPSPKAKWPSGAEFVLDHVQNKDAYEKYQGQEFQTIIWEEVTHCPSLELYRNVIRSARSSDPRMRPKVYCTANPDGDGLGWVRKYFWALQVCDDCQRPPGACKCAVFKPRPVRRGELWWDPKFPKLTRSVIHSTVYDNPFIQRNDPAYVQQLEAQVGVERRRWLLGDFDAFAGGAFDLFRPDGPLDKSEPPEARHVIQVGERPLAPWWPRVVGLDIGYRHSSAMLKGCIVPDGRLVIYGEQGAGGILAEEWGARLARWLLPELAAAPKSVIEVFVSHDAFARIGYDRTRAALLQAGVDQVLGRGSAFVIEQGEGEGIVDFFERYHETAPAARIVLRKVPNYWKRIDGWEYIRELMRWWPLAKVAKDSLDTDYANELIKAGEVEKYAQYMRMFEEAPPEVLPRLLLTADCPRMIEAFRTARFADTFRSDQAAEDVLKTNEESDDFLDAARHLCLGFQFKVEHEPKEYWMQKQIEAAVLANPNLDGARLWRIKARLHDQYDQEKRDFAGFSIRFGSPDHRGVRIQ